jgi:hypothetical protein
VLVRGREERGGRRKEKEGRREGREKEGLPFLYKFGSAGTVKRSTDISRVGRRREGGRFKEKRNRRGRGRRREGYHFCASSEVRER